MSSNSRWGMSFARQRAVWTVLLLGGCSALLGVEDGKVQGPCSSKAECAPAYDCLLGNCRNSCTSDGDCGAGARCLKAIGTSACIPASEGCGSACPDGTNCVGQVCRTECSVVEDCAGGQECQQGSCVGVDQTHDTPLSMAGAGGVAGGGSSSGGKSGSAAEAGSPGSVGDGGDGGAPPQVCVPQQPTCDGNRATNCNNDGTAYEGGKDCLATETCLAGACEPHECTPDAAFCAGKTVRDCASDGLSSTEVMLCSDQEYCDTATAACKTGVCAPNAPVCDGSRATTCTANGSGFVAGGTQCTAMQTCEAGVCEQQVCPPGETFCQADNLKSCSANGLASTLLKACTGLACVDAGTSASCVATIDAITGIKNAYGFALKDSFMLLPCYQIASFDCLTTQGACPNQAPANPEDKGYVFPEFFQIGGEAGKTYAVTLRVNGIVSGRYYVNGMRRNGTDFSNPDATQGTDTWYVGGEGILSNYDIYKISVFQPDKTTEVKHYYLNSFPQVSGFESHRTFPIGYDATIDVPGQGWIKYLVQDSNCRAINNCGPGDNGDLCPSPRTVPNEAGLQMPASYGGVATSILNTVNQANQPWHSQIVHITVKQVVEK